MHLNRAHARPGVATCAAWAAVALAAAAAVVVRAQAANPGSVLLTVRLPNRPAAGARVFEQKGCSRCHTLDGQSATRTREGPDLGRVLFSGTVLDIAGALWNHAPAMREHMQASGMKPPTLTSSDIADLVALLGAYRYYATEAFRAGDQAAGRRLFQTKGCARCHDAESQRWQGPGPGLEKYRGRSAPMFLAQAMWNHGWEMASAMYARGVPWPTFAPGEMDDLVAYLQTGGTSAPVTYFEPGSPRRGAELFSQKGCLACHAVMDRGGHGGPDLGLHSRDLMASVPTIAGLMWNHSQQMAAEFKRRGLERITFSGQEMVDVVAYLYFLNFSTVPAVPARGAAIFRAKCARCHAGSGPGPDLAARASFQEPFEILAAMWNHASTMTREAAGQGVEWPRLEPGEAADLTAFLLRTERP